MVVSIADFNKMTLIDYPEKIASTVFLNGCNFNCLYCHNASLIPQKAPNALIHASFFAYLEKRKGVLEGVCITGGEPLLNADIESFIYQIKALGYKVKLDTNGSYPIALERLVQQGLVDYVAMDIKNAFSRYDEVIGRKDFNVDLVKESLKLLENSPVAYELRTTLISPLHTRERMLELALDISGDHKYYLQNFRQSDEVRGKVYQGFSEETLALYLKLVQDYVPNTRLREI